MNSKHLAIAVAFTLVLAVSLLIFFWWMQPGKQVLFGNMEGAARETVIKYLSQEGITYEEREDGLYVEQQEVARIRFDLFEKGVLQPAREGLELFAEADYGMTEFAQKVNYQRAMQAELERTIAAINGIQFVRVHLKYPKKKVLFAKNHVASASVVVHLQDGVALTRNQVEGIKMLVAGAVENLESEHVVVLDQYGKPLSRGKESELMVADTISDHEKRLIGSAHTLLSQWLNDDEYSITVAVEVNQNKHKKRIEGYIDQGQPIVARKKESYLSAKGISKETTLPKDTEVEYLYGKEVEEIDIKSGQISRVSVGVIISPFESLPFDVSSLNRVLKSGLGLVEERGDSLELLIADRPLDVEMESFSENTMVQGELPRKVTALETPVVPNNEGIFNGIVSRFNELEVSAQLSLQVMLGLLVLILVLQLTRRMSKQKREAIERDAILVKVNEWLAS